MQVFGVKNVRTGAVRGVLQCHVKHQMAFVMNAMSVTSAVRAINNAPLNAKVHAIKQQGLV